jgi:hypothetical protein
MTRTDTREPYRRLTAGEIAFARQAFADSIGYERVWICDGAGGNPIAMAAFRNGNSAIALRRTIHFGDLYCENYAQAHSRGKILFVHEMTHILQYARLGVARFLAIYAWEFAACGFNARRMYLYEPGRTNFRSAMLEAQAQMAGDYYGAILAGNAAHAKLIAANLKGSGLYGL